MNDLIIRDVWNTIPGDIKEDIYLDIGVLRTISRSKRKTYVPPLFPISYNQLTTPQRAVVDFFRMRALIE